MTPNQTSGAPTVRLAGRVVVYARTPQSCEQLAQAIGRQGYDVERATCADSLKQALHRDLVAACLLDEPESAAFVEMVHGWIRERGQVTQLLVLPALGVRGETLPVRNLAEVLEPPHTSDRIGRALFAAVGRSRLMAENQQLRQDLDGRVFPDIIGHSRVMEQLRTQLRTIAEDKRPVVICGEPGTGTTFTARAIHTVRCGDRNPLLTVRCPVLSAAAAEEALFGTPSANGAGRLAAAAEGSLLLDDVDALPLSVQQQLGSALRRESHAGETATTSSHIIATTHGDLRAQSMGGGFDGQLLRQLAAHVVTLPPLRERREDIPLLAEHFLAQFAAREGLPLKQLTIEALHRLQGYAWPGNLRELENVLGRCCTLDIGTVITAEMISPWLEGECAAPADEMGLSLREMERKLIEATFTRFHGNRELTARALKIGLRTLSGKLREYGYPPRGGPGSNRRTRAA